eukprot:XP_014774753.1 PREDICTED: craniofacial development protein 2-like [Octopus bimaculoides]
MERGTLECLDGSLEVIDSFYVGDVIIKVVGSFESTVARVRTGSRSYCHYWQQSHLTAAVKKRGIQLRKEWIIATWNVRGLIVGKLNVITSEMKRCGVSVLGLSEHWWNGQGRFTAQSGDMVFSGRETGQHNGVGFVTSREVTPSVMGYNPVNDRIVTIRLRGHPLKTTRIQVYAPMSEASEEEMQDFYDVVQQTLDNVPRRDVIIVMRDWNAKVGKSITNNSSVGQHGLGERNIRGQDLVDLCITNNLDIGNIIFQHHLRRMYTWTSLGDRFGNQIDYIMIQGRWRSALMNVRT